MKIESYDCFELSVQSFSLNGTSDFEKAFQGYFFRISGEALDKSFVENIENQEILTSWHGLSENCVIASGF